MCFNDPLSSVMVINEMRGDLFIRDKHDRSIYSYFGEPDIVQDFKVIPSYEELWSFWMVVVNLGGIILIFDW